MRVSIGENDSCAVCERFGRVYRIEWGRDDILSLCDTCRKELIEKLKAPEDTGDGSAIINEAGWAVMMEAMRITEEEFDEKYLSDPVDMVIFEYVRGYGRTMIDDSAIGALAFMTETGAATVMSHINSLVERGILYTVAEKSGWYGADYPFSDAK